MSASFIAAATGRRSHRAIKNESTIPKEKIVEIVTKLVKEVPSPYNTQTSRVLILFGDDHKTFWKNVTDDFIGSIAGAPEEAKNALRGRLAGFPLGYGTIAVFEDQDVIAASKKQFGANIAPIHFDTWSQNSTGMLQYAIWTSLSAEGLGLSLQHHGSYAPVVDETIRKNYGVPASWKSTAFLPFGVPSADAPPREDKLDGRIKVVG